MNLDKYLSSCTIWAEFFLAIQQGDFEKIGLQEQMEYINYNSLMRYITTLKNQHLSRVITSNQILTIPLCI